MVNSGKDVVTAHTDGGSHILDSKRGLVNLACREQDTVSIPDGLALLVVAIKVGFGILLVGIIAHIGVAQEDVTVGCQCQCIIGSPGAGALVANDYALVAEHGIAIGVKNLQVQLVRENAVGSLTTQPGENDLAIIGAQGFHLRLALSAFCVQAGSLGVTGLPLGHHYYGGQCHHHQRKDSFHNYMRLMVDN